MIIFPSIDLKDGAVVRLRKGDFASVHTVASSALDTAAEYKKAGAEWLHTVDLDGARGGVRRSDEFEGYITADGEYFFRGEVAEGDQGDGGTGETTSSAPDGAPSPEGEGKDCEDFCEIPAAELGGDGLPLPAGAEKPKRKKRARDEGRE